MMSKIMLDADYSFAVPLISSGWSERINWKEPLEVFTVTETTPQ